MTSLREIHRAVRDALEDRLTNPHFLVGMSVWPVVGSSESFDAEHMADRIDLWLYSLDPDTRDASKLSTRFVGPAVTLKVHAIPKDVEDRDRRADPIVWNPEPLGLVFSDATVTHLPDDPSSIA